MLDHPPQQLHGRFDALELQVFVGLVRASDVAGPQHKRFAAELLKIRRFGGKRHRLGLVPGEALGQPYQLAFRPLLEGWHRGEQRRQVDFHLVLLGQRLQALAAMPVERRPIDLYAALAEVAR